MNLIMTTYILYLVNNLNQLDFLQAFFYLLLVNLYLVYHPIKKYSATYACSSISIFIVHGFYINLINHPFVNEYSLP